MKRGILFFMLFTIVSLSCNNDEAFSQNQEEGTDSSGTELILPEELLNSDFNILFIGNSLTYTNDLPELVKKEALAKGITVGTKMIALPNFAISDHWEAGEVQQYILSKMFDFVIVQQGPSSQQEGRDILIEYGSRYKLLCENNNAKFGYFMVWPSLEHYHTFNGVIKNHQDAASINNSILCPVGEVWKAHFDTTNSFDYYSSDGFHPSLLGSEIAAKVIVNTLF